MNEQETVLVTGASGFIALHCVVQALEAGYGVRGTLRTPSREAEVRETVARQADAGERLSFVTAELTHDAGWAEAVAGSAYVLHVASPFPAAAPKDENELIVPARDGALRVLRAAAAAGVKRVVLTSSIAAIAYGHDELGDHTFDEDDWSNIDGTIGAYEKSKTLAERAAWDFIASEEAKGMELAVINPGGVLGPILNEHAGTSAELVKRLLLRQLPACPRIGFSFVDVRDVAAAHLAAMTAPDAAGKRFACTESHAWIRDMALILDRHYADKGYNVPTKRMPDWLFRLAAVFDGTLKLVVRGLGIKHEVSSARLRETLNWQPHSLEEMTVAMADSLIEYGIVPRKG